MKLAFCLLSILLSVSSAHQAHADDHPALALDVLTIDFSTDKAGTGKISKKIETVHIATLELKANLNNNAIEDFNATVNIDGMDPIPFSAKLEELRNQTLPLKAQGVTLGSLQGLQMNADGEGTLRFTPKASLIAKGLPSYVDLQLKRVGAEKKWAVIYKSGVLISSDFKVSKDPREMSMLGLMMSPPQITKMDITSLSCDGKSIAAALITYRAPELLKLAQCNFTKIKASEIIDLMQELSWQANVYTHFYFEGVEPEKTQALVQTALRNLQSFGLDLTRFKTQDFVDPNDKTASVFSNLIAAGQEDAILDLISKGILPVFPVDYENALINVLQVDPATQKVAESPIGLRILETIKKYVREKPRASDVLQSVLGYEGSNTLTKNESDAGNGTGPYFDFTRRLVALMAQENVDFKTGDSQWNLPASSDIKSSTEGADTARIFFTRAQAKQLMQQINAAGGR